jgi:hypothetical protein
VRFGQREECIFCLRPAREQGSNYEVAHFPDRHSFDRDGHRRWRLRE